jgi:hypothetical protein
MATTELTPGTWLRPTPDGWLAGSDVFPRIAVVGHTEAEALASLEASRKWWLGLPDPDADNE